MLKTTLTALTLSLATLSTTASAAVARATPSKDAFVTSYNCCGMQDANFGTQDKLSVGQFHRAHSQAWIAFDFTDINFVNEQTEISLAIPATSLSTGNETTITISIATQDWDEQTLTFNNKPQTEVIATATLTNNEPTFIDISEAIYLRYSTGARSLSLVIDTNGQSNFTLASKDSTVEALDRPHLILSQLPALAR